MDTEVQTNDEIEVIPHEDGGKPTKVSQQVFYSAPLPPAAEFERYEKVLKGSADRIIQLAEKQSTHRRFLEKIVVLVDSIKLLGGMVFALFVVLAGLGVGLYLIMNDKSTEGLVTLFIPLGTIATAFILGKDKNKKDE